MTNQGEPWKVLIASSHPLFAKGLRSLLQKRKTADVVVVGLASTIEEALQALHALTPDLVIVDYDDEHFNRDEILARFVEGEGRLRVVLLSLKEGGDEAIVYDRRTMAASQIEDWLEKWTDVTEKSPERPAIPPRPGWEVKAKPTRRDDMKHYVAAALVVIAITAAGLFSLSKVFPLPPQASLQARWIDGLFDFEFKVIAFLFALIVGLMLYSIVFFRRRRGDTHDAAPIKGNTALELTWTILPLATVIYVSFLGASVLGETQRADPRPLEVNVIASQWSWRFEYPEWGITSTDLMLPVDKQALFHLSSTDVIHSFFVPEFRLKQDALPGGDEFIRNLRVTPTKIGDYKVLCAELCGRSHAEMVAPVKVMAQVDFDAWVQSQLAPVAGTPAERGAVWAEQFGCLACHTTDGTAMIGPTWKGLYEKEVTMEDGSKVNADEAYLEESINNPGAKIVAGFQNIMPPNIAEGMTDEQIQDLIEFIKTLK